MLKRYMPVLVMIFLSVFLSSALVSCNNSKNSTVSKAPFARSAVFQQTKKPVWTYNLILTFNGYKYKVTTEKTKDIDSMLGGISFCGKTSEAFQLYSIKNVKNYDKIAVDTKDGYLIAIKGNKDQLTP